jgi:uncharacterized protein (TIGR02246 family)
MRTVLTSCLLVLVLAVTVAPAGADATADGRAVSEAFEKAVAAGDLQAVLALYRDDATVIWPGQGEEAKGKAAITPLAQRFIENMKGAHVVLKSQQSIPLGEGYIVNVGRWAVESTTPDGRRVTSEVRTSEVLAKTDGKWLYLVDHASIGLPPPTAHRGHRGRR